MQTLDTQSGLNRIHNIKGTLNHFSACCEQSIFRGDQLPQELQGDYILPEPVGGSIRRAKVNNLDGKRVLYQCHPRHRVHHFHRHGVPPGVDGNRA